MAIKQLKQIYVLAISLLVVGVICYTVPAKPPEKPLRVMYPGVAGRVLFNHQVHMEESGYGVSCKDCHHHPKDGSDTGSCANCHSTPPEGKMVSENCLACHESDELEEIKITKRADAFHSQCVQCHKEYEAGPTECSGCHIP